MLSGLVGKGSEMTRDERINNAFKELRKLGYFARQNFMCCQTCGWAEVPDDKANRAVFYHRQDTEHFNRNGELYLAWDGDGNEIIKTFQSVGLTTEWDGSSDTRIKVITK